MSFGKDPNSSTEQGNGVGVYSTPYCIKGGSGSGEYGANYESNCGQATGQAYTAVVASTAYDKVLDLTNSIEIKWVLPYKIPNDRTEAEIICKTD